MSFFDSLFGSPQQVQTTTLDPQTQAYVNQMRGMAQSAAGQIAGGQFFGGPTGTFMSGVQGLLNPAQAGAQFFNPYQQDVVNATQADFARQKQQALTDAAQQATGAGAYGGSRSGILQAQALNDVNRNESATLAGLRQSGWNNAMNMGAANAQSLLGAGYTQGQLQDQVRQNPIFAAQAAQSLLQGGMGPYGSTTTQGTQTPWLQNALKLGATAATLFG